MPLAGAGGRRQPLTAEGAPLLVCVGHGECGTTTLLLPFVDRVHRRGGRALAVLQEEDAEARALVRELGLALPVLRDGAPYALAEALDLTGVPLLVLLDGHSRVQRVSEGFVRADVEELAEAAGSPRPLYGPDEVVPALRPG